MDEAALGAWQRALVEALVQAETATDVRARLLDACPEQRAYIDGLDDRALAAAIAIVRRWAPR
ncbi:MAG TPA: hypothetical protein VG755_39890 [Nannocystaceae bacterium]|nr:hypothetical protein [Nannocystaceae bacterium]